MDKSIQSIPRMLTGEEVCELRGHGKQKCFDDIRRGVLVPPIRRGKRDSRYPSDEIAQIIRAEIAGATVEERQELVRKLIAARTARAS